jgi:hypothetical protein
MAQDRQFAELRSDPWHVQTAVLGNRQEMAQVPLGTVDSATGRIGGDGVAQRPGGANIHEVCTDLRGPVL